MATDDAAEADDDVADVDEATEDAINELAAEDTAADAETEEELCDAAHETIFHVHPPLQPLPSSSHVGCEQIFPHAAVDPLPESHSSPTDCDTMPSPHRTVVHSNVQLGPMPLRPPSSHSSP